MEPIDNRRAQEVFEGANVSREEFIQLCKAVDEKYIFLNDDTPREERAAYRIERDSQAIGVLAYVEILLRINAFKGWGLDTVEQRLLNRLSVAQFRMLGYKPEDGEDERDDY